MEQYLTVNNLWDIVDGTETEPTDVAAKAGILRKQKAAWAHIALHISPSHLNSVHLKTNPENIWNELECHAGTEALRPVEVLQLIPDILGVGFET